MNGRVLEVENINSIERPLEASRDKLVEVER